MEIKLGYNGDMPKHVIVSGDIMNLFYTKKINAQELVLVMTFIDILQNKEGPSKTVSTTNKKLVDITGFSRRSIITYIKNLEANKVIYIERECKMYLKDGEKEYEQTRLIKLNMYVR